MYVFGTRRAIVTSANLTEAALLRNHEFGIVAEEAGIVAECIAYFDTFWRRAGVVLSERLAKIEAFVLGEAPRSPSDGQIPPAGLGVKVGDEPNPRPPVNSLGRSFVKFLGRSDNRAFPSLP